MSSEVGGSEAKTPFDITRVFRLLRRAVAEYPKAAMFDLRDRGFGSPFEQLVGSQISARTRDEETLAVCLRLFARARTPAEMTRLEPETLTSLLQGAAFARAKAGDILLLSREILEKHEGRVPDTLTGLTQFRGVGPKVAALTLAVGFNRPAIAVDIHVHRIVNRWGYVSAATPEKTAAALSRLAVHGQEEAP